MSVQAASQRVWLVGLLLVTVLFGVKWQMNLSKYYQVDFSAYWSAGKALNDGIYRYSYHERDGRGNLFGHAMFLNPPIVAQPFRIIALWPYHSAKIIWQYFQLSLFALTIFLLARSFSERVAILSITVIGMPFIFWPLFAELERGETNMIIMLAIALSYFLWRKKMNVMAGVVLGLGSVFKFPLLAIFAVPFALKQWRFLLAGMAVFVGTFLGSLIIDGIEINRDYFVTYLPIIALKDHLPDQIYSIRDTPKPPSVAWEGRTYVTRYPFDAPSGSATRFFRSLSGNRFDRSLIFLGALATGLAIWISAIRFKVLKLDDNHRRRWGEVAWSLGVMAVLILHTLSWITNYVLFIIPVVLLWRQVLEKQSLKRDRIIVVGLLLATFAIVVGDSVVRLFPSPNLTTDIIIRNRTWLGGGLVWLMLAVSLLVKEWGRKMFDGEKAIE